jgi:hypothetical protein
VVRPGEGERMQMLAEIETADDRFIQFIAFPEAGEIVYGETASAGPNEARLSVAPGTALDRFLELTPDHFSESIGRLDERGAEPKRLIALRQFALGHEALHRFVGHESRCRILQCVFGLLALKSEPVDPCLQAPSGASSRLRRMRLRAALCAHLRAMRPASDGER